MPWMNTNPSKQRQQFYRDYASGQWSMSELCDRYQISRPTGYKWVDRIENEGLKAVKDRSRAPFGHPNRTPERVEREVLALREKYGWGATKQRTRALGHGLAAAAPAIVRASLQRWSGDPSLLTVSPGTQALSVSRSGLNTAGG
jgi:transposase-like protein